MPDDIPQHSSPLQAGTDRVPPPPPRWSAVQAAREAGVSRSTIHDALKSGRIEATKDEHGAWQITPQALISAGYSPGRPTKVHERPTVEDRDDADDLSRLRVELAEARADARVAGVERDAERRLREAVERERDLYRRMLEAPRETAPSAPQTAAQPVPDPMPTPAPAGPPQANVGRFRRAWNVLRY